MPMADYPGRIVNNECRGAALGLLKTHFKGLWVSSIDATLRASDKILQLKVAADCGIRVPRTLVTQSPSAVKAFFEECGPLVVKTIVGAAGPMLQTIRIDDPTMFSADEYRASPAMYQEYIGGCEHLRLACFGEHCLGGIIHSVDVDWRGNLNVPVKSVTVSEDLKNRVRSIVAALGLEMGVIDIKLTTDGEPVWLEVNPQGQFAFLDGLAGTNLIGAFAKYLTLCEQTA